MNHAATHAVTRAYAIACVLAAQVANTFGKNVVTLPDYGLPHPPDSQIVNRTGLRRHLQQLRRREAEVWKGCGLNRAQRRAYAFRQHYVGGLRAQINF